MYLPANENEVAAVADDHRVVVEHREQFAVDAGRMDRIGLAGQQRPVGRQRGPGRLGQPRHPLRVRLPRPSASRWASPSQRGEERGQVARCRGGQRDVRGDPARRVGHVHHPGRGVLRAERAVPQPEVQRCPGHDDQVGAAQGRRPGPGHQQLVSARQHAARLAVGDHRQAQCLGCLPGRVLGAAQPDVGAEHEDRMPGRSEQSGDVIHVAGVRGGRRRRSRDRPARPRAGPPRPGRRSPRARCPGTPARGAGWPPAGRPRPPTRPAPRCRARSRPAW